MSQHLSAATPARHNRPLLVEAAIAALVIAASLSVCGVVDYAKARRASELTDPGLAED